MGYLRSCYSTMARFFYDSSEVQPIIWYWADPDATVFAEGNVFAPLIFQGPATLQVDGVGEQPSYPRPWRDGSIPVSPPSQVLDGEVRWFQQGQSVNDPGLDRTAFGIPTNCTTPIIPYCAFGELNHATWSIGVDDDSSFGTSVREAVNYCQFTTDLFPGLTWQLVCGVPDVGPPYDGLFLRVTSGFGFTAVFWPPVQVGPGPQYKFAVYYGSTPPNPIYINWLPGP